MPPAEPSAGGKVSEKDVVMMLHSRGEMPLKELVKCFKGSFADNPEGKQEFIKMVSRVARLNAEDGDRKNVAKLRESTIAEYGLK